MPVARERTDKRTYGGGGGGGGDKMADVTGQIHDGTVRLVYSWEHGQWSWLLFLLLHLFLLLFLLLLLLLLYFFFNLVSWPQSYFGH